MRLLVYYIYLTMQYQNCTGHPALFEAQENDGIGFRYEGNIVKSERFYYDMNYTVQPDFYSKPAHKPRRPIVNPVFPFTFDEVYGN